MEVLNKLRSTVTSTVSQLSGVLPGNPVTREYEVCQLIGSAGTGLLWKIYSGYKCSTKQGAAVFVFEKKQLDRWSRNDREVMLDVLRQGVSQLTRIRHPQVLTVQHPLEESRESLAFATEPVFASLANVLGATENLTKPLPKHLKDCKLFEVEIKYGLLQISEGVAFLHNDMKVLHRSICPENIVINQQGAWKLFGFDFCVHNKNPPDQSPFWSFKEYLPEMHPFTQPNLDFLAPEYALTLTCDQSSDMFAIGMLAYAVFNSGKPLFPNGGEWTTFKRSACDLKHLSASNLQCVPDQLREYIKLLLNVTPEVRPDAHQFSKVEFFDDVGVKTLSYLDSLFQWDNLQKSQFYKALPQIIAKLPHRVSLYRIMPCLAKEFVNPTMIPFVLPNVLLIAQEATKDDFVTHILPSLKPVMKIQEPIQILLIFMQRMELLLQKTPAEDVKSHVLPVLYQALESDATQIQELCLSVIPSFASLVDYPAMKNALLPRIKKLCIHTPYLSVRVNCLVCIGKLLEHLDKWLVIDEVLPLLPQIPSREPAVVMASLGIYKIALTHKKLGISKELIATKVLPFLIPLSIENGLTVAQFNTVMIMIKDMINRVETEHRVKLEQLNSVQDEQKSAFQMATSSPSRPDELIAAPEPQSELDQMFSGFGLSSFVDKTGAATAAAKLVTDPAVPNKIISNGSVKSPVSLTLEEKQRLARDQEAQHRLRLQSPISAPPSMPAKANNPPPKDLTSTLIDSNLGALSLQPKPSPVRDGPSFSPNPYVAPMQQVPSRMPMSFQPPPVNNQWRGFSPTQPSQPAFPRYTMPGPAFNTGQAMPTTRQGQDIKPLSSSDINDLLS